MSETRSVSGIVEVIESITSNHESGRLEIVSSGTRGSLKAGMQCVQRQRREI